MLVRPTFRGSEWQVATSNPSPLNIPPAQVPPLVRVRDNVVILGFATIGLDEAPFDDPAWEVWGLNSGWGYARDSENRFRADRWFELHEMSAQTPDELDAIRACPAPIYLTDPPTSDIPRGIEFPLKTLDETFGAKVPYAATFCYQIAFALLLGYRRIGIYGVELQYGTLRERTVERAAVNYWVGFARGRGVEVILPEISAVCYHPARYGFEYDQEVDLVQMYNAETAAVAAMWLQRKLRRNFLDTYGKLYRDLDP